MKPIILDTNVLIDFCQNPDAFKKSQIANSEQVLIPTVVLGEFKAGIFANRRGEETNMRLNQLVGYPSVDIIPATERTADMYAKVYQALRREGTPIPQNDMWIAASALEHGADLATHDEHFRLVPMLSVIIP